MAEAASALIPQIHHGKGRGGLGSARLCKRQTWTVLIPKPAFLLCHLSQRDKSRDRCCVLSMR